MNFLVITGQLYPRRGNNSNLISKLLPHLINEHTVHIAAPASAEYAALLPAQIGDCPVHWILDDRKDLTRKLVYPIISKLTDLHGYSDAVQTLVLASGLKAIRKEYPFDAVISTMEPFPSACAALQMPKQVKKVLYLMDPPAVSCGSAPTPYRQRMLGKVFAGHNLVLTTPFIREALASCGYGPYCEKMVEVGFPMIEPHPYVPTPDDIPMNSRKINLLFCGWLYGEIRSPKYFLDIAAKLDERFCLYFMGKECELLRERFDFQTRAQVVTLPQQPYQVALNAMHDADILINIGNSIPVHMPSKTLEYINTGKPMVNFYKLDDCPTLHYTKRYPLCLNLHETDNLEQAAQDFIRFCTENKGNTTDRSRLAEQLPECTPQYIAQKILQGIGARYE